MAGALGLVTGMGLGALGGYAQQKGQEKAQHEQLWDQFMFSNMTAHPEMASTAPGQKEIKRMFGEHADAATSMLNMATTAKAQAAQQTQAALGDSGGAPDAKGPHNMSSVDELNDHIEKLTKYEAAASTSDPNWATHKPIFDQEIKNAQERIKSLTTQQEHQETLDARKKSTDAMYQIAKMNADSIDTFRIFMKKMDQEKEADAQQKNFDGAKASLQKQMNTIRTATLGTGTTPAMTAEQLKPQLDSYNKQAAALARRAKASGVDYDPEEFVPLTATNIKNHPILRSWSSTTTTLSEAGPMVVNDKGEKLQWDGKAWSPVK